MSPGIEQRMVEAMPRLLPTKYTPILAAALFALLGWITLHSLEKAWAREVRAEERNAVAEKLGELRDRADLGLQALISTQTALVALVAQNPDMDQALFERGARSLLGNSGDIRSVSLAKDSTVSHLYPFAANQRALGLDLANHPEQGEAVRRAIANKTTVLSGPVTLVQGGEALITRTPIYLGPNADAYWGMSTILVQKKRFLERAFGANSVEKLHSTLEIGIWGRDAKGKQGELIWGSNIAADNDPATVAFSVPGGSWHLAAYPKGGWAEGPEQLWRFRVLAFLLTATVAFFVWFIVENHQKLAKEVDARRRSEEALILQAEELSLALTEVRTLEGMLPICANCKSVRDDQGLWNRVERYIEEHSQATLSHGICPDCMTDIYGAELSAKVQAELEAEADRRTEALSSGRIKKIPSRES